MEVNKEQLRAITHKDGPMMVLAGPGSGKTLVITRRVAELINTCRVRPENILVITFTRAAALEMEERFSRLSGGSGTRVNFGTFHAVFYKILKYAYNYKASNILRDDERNKILRDIVRSMNLKIEDESEFLESVGSEISRVKNERIDLKNYYSINCPEQDFRSIYNAYEKSIRAADKIDFDDMLALCYELLIQRQDILSFWQQRYKYVLIDEFQDINRLQYDIIRLLALPENNLFIVGDDDQSIYRFRGAKPEIMLGFENDFPGCKRATLDKNYRSTQHIVRAAMNLIRHNTKRFEKDIKSLSPGEPVYVREYANQRDENKAIVEMVLERVRKGARLCDMAVLYRTNTQPRALTERLMEFNIPFYMKDKTPCIYDHWIAQNIFDYINIARGSRERGAFLRIINRPKRYISRDAFDSETVSFDSLLGFYDDKEYVADRIEKLEYDLSVIGKLNPAAAIRYIRCAVGYDDYLKEYAQYRGISFKELEVVADEFWEAAKGYETFDDWYAHIEDYREELYAMERERKKSDGDALQLMTFHGSKGLEYETVFILDANEEITPHEKAILPEDIEEERRMFYVALTRAKREAFVFYCRERYSKKAARSRFIDEMMNST